jgi:hypothetical protein
MEGIRFLLDEKGRKVAVQIDLDRHGELWEDMYDALVMREREREPREDWAEVKKRLAKSRRSSG